MSEHDGNDSPVSAGGTEVITQDADDGWGEVPDALPIELPESADARYDTLRELARGSMGVVKIARDLSLQRLVALKELRPEGAVPNAAARFLDEARITAQLQHPGIVAVYEIGVDAADERPFFTMQLVEGRTLEAILVGLRAGDPDMVRRFSRARLLSLFNQVCMAVAYAHSRGVIHRDLKPANIMLGEFGEVFVMDWGLAKIVRAEVAHPVVGGRPDEDVFRTRVGDITGTPSYMSPEQAMGLVDALSERTDIYSLGAILYEILAGRPPFVGETAQAILRQVRAQDPVPVAEAAPGAEVAPHLDAVVMRCLQRDPNDRFASAKELRDEVEASMLGSRTSIRRVQGAGRTLREAQRAGQSFRELARRRRRLAREVAEAASLRLRYDTPEQVEADWQRQASLQALEAELDHAFENAVALLHQILGEVPEHREAHEAMRDLLWYRFLEAERAGDRPAMALYRSLAVRHDPQSSLRAAIAGEGSLRVETEPAGARVTLWRYAPEAQRLVAVDRRDCGQTPMTLDPLPMGAYLLELAAPGCAVCRIPVCIGRQETAEMSIRLLPTGALPESCVHIPAGPAWLGARNPELSAPPRARVVVHDFAIARTPVTLDAYAEFLNALVESGEVHRAIRHAGDPELWRQGADGHFHPTDYGGNPVAGVSFRDALAYATWCGARDGLPWRLPTAEEWEKAGRGSDGRAYPWGDVWDSTLCRCADSPEGGAASAVGNESDESPYGARDFAGGVREWTSTEHPRDTRQRVTKGGGFLSPRAECHLAARRHRKLDRPAADVGFRLALDLP